METLPFIVGTNPYIARALNALTKSFQWLVSCPRVKTLEENAMFVSELDDLLKNHANDIPTLAKGCEYFLCEL